MKIIYYFFIILSLFSCSKDDVNVDSIVYVESITIIGSNIISGTIGQMTAEVLPVDADNKTIAWSTSDVSIATISSSGVVTALQNGIVTITATAIDKNVIIANKEISISSFKEDIIENESSFIVSTVNELIETLSKVKPGDTILINEGNYVLNNTLNISLSGTSGNKINLFGRDGQGRPKLDFSLMVENSSNRGVYLNAEFWHIKGIDVFGAGDNGMFVKGNNNLIEFCTFSENSDTGLQIGNGASNNTILNCDSFYNADSTLENADGFACKLDAGTGNKFIGCRAWQNLDDGWDGYLRGADDITTTYENCWSFKNGILKNGTVGVGDGNGFKTGGSDDKLLKHNAIYKNCISAGNVYDGFDHNSNRGNIEIYNCSAFSNGRNISFSNTNIANSLILKNTASLGGSNNDSFAASTTDITNNSWQNDITIDTSDFVSLNMDLLSSPRNSDGSLPNIDFMKLVSGSDLIDKGIDVELPFNGIAPDLGAFEF
jgi:hypothetical protein